MRDHAIFFSALKLPQDSTLRAVSTLLQTRGIVPTFECEELKYDRAQQCYHWTGEFITCSTLEEATALARRWESIATYFKYTVEDILGSLSVLLWGDTALELTTLALCEDSALFNFQREHPEHWVALQETLLSLAESLGSSFFLLKTNSPVRTITEEEISELLNLMKKGRQVPILLAVHVGRFPGALTLNSFSSADHEAHKRREYVVFADKQMGFSHRKIPEGEQA